MSMVVSPRSRLRSLGRAVHTAAMRIEAALDRRFWVWTTAFVAIFLVCSIMLDLRTRMWIDELYTLAVAQQANPREVVKALLEGCDGQPPLYDILVHDILSWVRPDPLAVRLPSTLGFCVMLFSLAAFCRRRMSASYAMTATLVAGYIALPFSTEGRSYGIVLGCTATALLCWQLAVDGRHRRVVIPIFALCLAIMTAAHFFTMFFAVPILVAEAMRWRASKKLDWPLLAAMSPIPLVLALHYPLIAATGKFEKHYWSPATWQSVGLSLGELRPWQTLNIVIFFVWFAIFLITAARLTKFDFSSPLRPYEWIAAGTFYLLPPAIAILSIYTTHVFVARYILWTAPGLAICAVAPICVLARRRAAVGLGLLAIMLALMVRQEHKHLVARPMLIEGQAVSDELSFLPGSSAPIVIADHHAFVELSYYAVPPIRQRLLYLDDPGLDLRYLHFDTGALLMSAIRYRSSLHVVDFNTALARYPHFFVVSTPKDYVPRYLASIGYRVVLLHSSPNAALYEVWASSQRQLNK